MEIIFPKTSFAKKANLKIKPIQYNEVFKKGNMNSPGIRKNVNSQMKKPAYAGFFFEPKKTRLELNA